MRLDWLKNLGVESSSRGLIPAKAQKPGYSCNDATAPKIVMNRQMAGFKGSRSSLHLPLNRFLINLAV